MTQVLNAVVVYTGSQYFSSRIKFRSTTINSMRLMCKIVDFVILHSSRLSNIVNPVSTRKWSTSGRWTRTLVGVTCPERLPVAAVLGVPTRTGPRVQTWAGPTAAQVRRPSRLRPP